MKRIILTAVAATGLATVSVVVLAVLGFAACDGNGMGSAGVDAEAGGVDVGSPAVDTLPPVAACSAVVAKQFGGTPCLLQVPDGVGCSTAVLYIDGAKIDDAEYARNCGASPQLSVYGEACSNLERHAVASIGCL